MLFSDLGLRSELHQLRLRGDEIARSLTASHGRGRKPIAFHIVNTRQFNAFADEDDAHCLVGIEMAVPLLNTLLFSKLLMEPELLPWLETSGQPASDFEAPFMLDPLDFERQAQWAIKLNPIRAFAASTIADFCSTFVLCHEFGHVLSGHIEAHQHHFGSTRVLELVEPRRTSAEASLLRQTWEYDADRTSIALLFNFVDELVVQVERNPRVTQVFAHGEGRHLEHVLAVVIAALFAFFAYLQGMRLKLRKDASHPHPYVRGLYLNYMLVQMARQNAAFDLEVFNELRDQRLDEMMIVLERLGLMMPGRLSYRFIQRSEREVQKLIEQSDRFHALSSPWRWI